MAIFAHPLEYAEHSIFEDMRSSGIWKVANGGAEEPGSFDSKLLSIFYPSRREAINLSGARNCPRLSVSGTIALIASSFSVGSARR